MHALLLVGLLRAGRWQRTRCRTALSIEPAPAGFVGDEDLEPGETCLQALWATEDGVLLAAGALVSHVNDFNLWLGDASSDASVGPNRQLRGAIPLALRLLATPSRPVRRNGVQGWYGRRRSALCRQPRNKGPTPTFVGNPVYKKFVPLSRPFQFLKKPEVGKGASATNGLGAPHEILHQIPSLIYTLLRPPYRFT